MTNCKEALEYYLDKEKEKRKLVYPAIYRHFKHEENGPLNNYMYAVMGISEPLEAKKFPKDIWNNTMIGAKHTETQRRIIIHVIDGKMYHPTESCKDKIVIYKSLYDNEMPYARPLDMFLEEVPEGKENPSGQKYRFELVSY